VDLVELKRDVEIEEQQQHPPMFFLLSTTGYELYDFHYMSLIPSIIKNIIPYFSI
jgi:hypothetical protein